MKPHRAAWCVTWGVEIGPLVPSTRSGDKLHGGYVFASRGTPFSPNPAHTYTYFLLFFMCFHTCSLVSLGHK